MIVDAIRQAPTEHVVNFLLTSYLAARAHDKGHSNCGSRQFPIREAVEVVRVAAERLARFRRPPPADIPTRRRVFGAR